MSKNYFIKNSIRDRKRSGLTSGGGGMNRW